MGYAAASAQITTLAEALKDDSMAHTSAIVTTMASTVGATLSLCVALGMTYQICMGNLISVTCSTPEAIEFLQGCNLVAYLICKKVSFLGLFISMISRATAGMTFEMTERNLVL